MKNKIFAFLVSFLAAAWTSSAAARKPDFPLKKNSRLQKLVDGCMRCHNESGSFSTFPIIKGQRQLYLKIQLENFKSGIRPHPIMTKVVSGLTPEDIDGLSKFFGSSNSVIVPDVQGAGK